MAIKDMSKFQLIFTGIFAVFIIVGVLVFALYRGDSKSAVTANLTVWGAMSPDAFASLVADSGLKDEGSITVSYVQKTREQFETDFIEALADGTGPDLVFIGQDQILKHRNKLFPLPYQSLDERTFKDTYIQAAEILMQPDGIIAIPVAVDPMVMYWNRSIFQNASLSQPPRYWDEFFGLTQSLTKKDGALNITQSAIALGEYRNITHAKEIISTLIMQAGSPLVMQQGGNFSNVFNARFDKPLPPAEVAVNFYTEFSNPAKAAYSWNRSLPNSKDAFIAGDLAVYFGYASEVFDIQDKNPNLNFDVAYMPQSRESENKITYGRLNTLAIVRNSKNIAAAAKTAVTLSNKPSGIFLVNSSGLAPVRRDILAERPTTAHGVILYNSALWAMGWPDPNDRETDMVFRDMIESITSGRARTSEAISKATSELTGLLEKIAPRAQSSTSAVPVAI